MPGAVLIFEDGDEIYRLIQPSALWHDRVTSGAFIDKAPPTSVILAKLTTFETVLEIAQGWHNRQGQHVPHGIGVLKVGSLHTYGVTIACIPEKGIPGHCHLNGTRNALEKLYRVTTLLCAPRTDEAQKYMRRGMPE